MGNIISVDVNCGLANRMRVLDCFLDLANRYDKRMVLYWPLDYSLYCAFEDLFEMPQVMVKIVSYDLLHSRMHRYARRFQMRLIRMRYSKTYHQRDIEKLAAERRYSCIMSDRKPYIETITRLYIPEKPYSHLMPIKALRDKIDAFSAQFDQNVIGIHIRRGDNYRAINLSRLDLFITRMQGEIARNSKLRFFLATDDHSVEKKLVELFPGRIIGREKISLERSDPKGIQDALIDLYCLSRTQRILGSFHSSFSEEAALLGMIPLEIVQ
jgi:hypothetical protein